MMYHWGLVTGVDDPPAQSKRDQAGAKSSIVMLPTLVVSLKSIPLVKAELGAHFCVALSESGRVFTWGTGKRGRLGHGSESDELRPREIAFFNKMGSKITGISVGSWHSLALAENGQVFAWGSNTRGECGLAVSDQQLLKPSIIPFPSRVVKIAGGHQTSAAITEDGRLFTWGSGVKGKLGRSIKAGFSPTPTEVVIGSLLNGESIVDIAFGVTFGGCITSMGRVFMFGSNSCGQLGCPKTSLAETFSPVLVDFPATASEEDRFIVGLSCSKGEFHSHTMALSRLGRIWVFGDNYKSKLGTGTPQDEPSPRLLPSFSQPDDPVEQVAAGGIHSAARTRSGAIWTWGCGSDGRLGHPEYKGHRYLYKEDVPRRVEQDASSQSKWLACCYYSCCSINSS